VRLKKAAIWYQGKTRIETPELPGHTDLILRNGKILIPSEYDPATHRVFRLQDLPHVFIFDPLKVDGRSLYFEHFPSHLSSDKALDYFKHIIVQTEFNVTTGIFLDGMVKARDGKILVSTEYLSTMVTTFQKYYNS
jgi:hypothetical protein